MTEPEPWGMLRELTNRKLALRVIAALVSGPQRYIDVLNYVTRCEGRAIHSQTISTTLRWLRDEGYADHHDEPAEYWLTQDGCDLVRIIADIESLYQRRLRERPDTNPE